MYPTVHKDSRGGQNRASINQVFFKRWSPSMAYILGFIFADGAIEDVQKSSRTCYVQFTSKDLSLLENIKTVLQSTHKISTRLPRINTFTNGRQYRCSQVFNLRVGNKHMYNDLLKLGVTPRKSLTAAFPKIPASHLSFFLRGYFDGDGCLYLRKGKYPRVTFVSGSEQFLSKLSANLTQALAVPYKTLNIAWKRGGNPCYHLQYGSRAALKILKFMYQNLNQAPYLERKFLIYRKYLKLKKAA
ncbi:MAG: hypothetical protein M1142_01125 [Patescibacteria group bacterium]|nr:hypothetical protein [Patescibacteria group bacterium]